MSQSVLEALKHIDPKSTATKWVIPGKQAGPTPPKKEEPKPSNKIDESSNKPEPVKEKIDSSKEIEQIPQQKEDPKPSPENTESSIKIEEKQELVKEEDNSNEKQEEPILPQKEDSKPSTEIAESSIRIEEKQELVKEEDDSNEKQEEQTPPPKESIPIQKEEPKQTEISKPKTDIETKPTSNAKLNRIKSEPSPDFKKRLEEIHSKPNRPGVIAQHDYNYQEPPEKHASYTQLKKKSTWAGPAPKTFGQKVDWLGETGEFHTYQYKQPERKNYSDHPSSQNNNKATEGPSERKVGVDQNAVPSKSKFSALLSVYNGGQ
ncbi:hypothetical protein M9Y10_044366 [Tritrichomonas musculus]|uniref:Uncharacterized protein n=1 Tax=Tritrichomonas musculus TaxID=1915356 RepID=A0ABR2GNQ2_9EUKA